jgi:hypothetical protein
MIRTDAGAGFRYRKGYRVAARFVPILLGLMVLTPLSTIAAQISLQPFFGRWDMSLKTGEKELPSWIEVSEEHGKPRVVMVGITDHATQLVRVQFNEGELEFVSPKGEEGFSEDMTFKGKAVGGQLVGTVTGSSGTSWPWVGKRAPALKRTSTPAWGKPITPFNGKDFTGWRFSDTSQAGNWKVQNGELVTLGQGAEIITIAKFQDFKLHVEFNCTSADRSNSGVFLRGRYEVQIETNSLQEPASHHTGGVYGFIDPIPEPPRKTGWQTFDITLVGRTVTVVQNGQKIIDNKEIPGITGGALDSHEGMAGPIYLQGSEDGNVAFRNIVIIPAVK